MNKGCIIALVVSFAVVVLGGIIIGVVFGPKLMKFGISTSLFAMEESAKNYLKANPDANIPASNEEWVKVLKGTDHDVVMGRPMEIDRFIFDGKFINPQTKQEAVFMVNEGDVKVVYPGADGKVGTSDDLTSASARKLTDIEK